jgi:hypothetical protein
MAIEFLVKSVDINSPDATGHVNAPLIVSGITGSIPNVLQINIDNTLSLNNNGSGVVTLSGINDSLLVHKSGSETITGVKTFIPDQIIAGLTVGRGAGSIATNVALGIGSLSANTSGGNNTSVGSGSLSNNTVASYGTAVGYNALRSNVSGLWNTAVGAFCAPSSTGDYNSAFGAFAMYSSVSVKGSTVIGASAMSGSVSGQFNVVIGANAFQNDISGYNNTVVGTSAGGANKIPLSGDTLYHNVFIKRSVKPTHRFYVGGM